MRRLATAVIALWMAGFGALPFAAAQVNHAFGVDTDYSCGDTDLVPDFSASRGLVGSSAAVPRQFTSDCLT